MPKETLASFWRYGCAVLAVVLATAVRLGFDPLLRNHAPFLTYAVAIVFTAWYGGLGPSLLALVLSWFSGDYFFLQSRGALPFFGDRSQIGLAFFLVGLTVSLLGELVRTAQRRARASAAETRRALEGQQVDREWLRITLASIADAVITTDSQGSVISLNPVAEQLTGWSTALAAGPSYPRGIVPTRLRRPPASGPSFHSCQRGRGSRGGVFG